MARNEDERATGERTDTDEGVHFGGKSAVIDSESSDSGEFIEPDTIGTAHGTGDGERKPRRKYRKRTKEQPASEAQKDLNGLLYMLHLGLAKITGIEELELDAEESKELADAIARVQSYHPDTFLSGEAIAWAGLVIACGKVYAPRFIAYKRNHGKAKLATVSSIESQTVDTTVQ